MANIKNIRLTPVWDDSTSPLISGVTTNITASGNTHTDMATTKAVTDYIDSFTISADTYWILAADANTVVPLIPANGVGAEYLSAFTYSILGNATGGTIYATGDITTDTNVEATGYVQGSDGNFGAFNTIGGFNVIVGGDSSEANGDYSLAAGESAVAGGIASFAIGESVEASADYSSAIGNSTQATAQHAHAQGISTVASGIASHAQNSRAQAIGDCSHAGGNATSGAYSIKASGETSFAHLRVSSSGNYGALGDYSVALGGENNKVNSTGSVVLGGRQNTLTGENSAIIGGNSITSVQDNMVYVPALMLSTGTAPSAPEEGTIYFNSSDKHFYGYNGTGWIQLDN